MRLHWTLARAFQWNDKHRSRELFSKKGEKTVPGRPFVKCRADYKKWLVFTQGNICVNVEKGHKIDGLYVRTWREGEIEEQDEGRRYLLIPVLTKLQLGRDGDIALPWLSLHVICIISYHLLQSFEYKLYHFSTFGKTTIKEKWWAIFLKESGWVNVLGVGGGG